jgi:protein CpxP
MRILKSTGMVLALALAGSVSVYAQATQTPDSSQTQGEHRQWHHHQPNPQMETRMLTKRLNLTADQAAQVEPILASQQESMKALMPTDGTKPDFQALHAQRKAIMEQTQQKLATVLTPEQQQQLANMHHGPHGHGEWAPKAGSSPSA